MVTPAQVHRPRGRMPEVAIHSEGTVFTDQPTLLGVGVFDRSHIRRPFMRKAARARKCVGPSGTETLSLLTAS